MALAAWRTVAASAGGVATRWCRRSIIGWRAGSGGVAVAACALRWILNYDSQYRFVLYIRPFYYISLILQYSLSTNSAYFNSYGQ
jgi:hypothetical protein